MEQIQKHVQAYQNLLDLFPNTLPAPTVEEKWKYGVTKKREYVPHVIERCIGRRRKPPAWIGVPMRLSVKSLLKRRITAKNWKIVELKKGKKEIILNGGNHPRKVLKT